MLDEQPHGRAHRRSRRPTTCRPTNPSVQDLVNAGQAESPRAAEGRSHMTDSLLRRARQEPRSIRLPGLDRMTPVLRVTALPDGKICDYIDGKIRADTPEEYVRQNIERRLVLELGYDPNQVAVEFPIRMGSDRKRVDLAIFPSGESHAQDNIQIIIECKKDTIEPSDRRDGIGQLKSYMSACPNAEWGMWTNARQKAVFRRSITDKRTTWLEPNDIPRKDSDGEEVDRPQRGTLSSAVEDNLLFSFRICHNHIYVTDGMQKQPAFFELLKVIFCKIYDERNLPHPLEFYATTAEKSSNDGRLTVFNRISKIFAAVKRRYPAIFESNDLIRLQSRSLAYIVGELQRYSFLETDVDVKGKAYEELVGANLRGDRGEFFTPRNVQRMAVRMLDVQIGDRFLDPACGTGGFPVIAMNEVIGKLHTAVIESGLTGAAAQQALSHSIDDTVRRQFFGIDINPDLIKATKMNMVMNNDGAGNIFREDTLLHPHQWEDTFRQQLADALNISPVSFRTWRDLCQFDVIATNPPFGSKLPIKDTETLSQYQLGHIWRKRDGAWELTEQFQNSQAPEILFIERCWQFLKPGGRMAIVLPDAILGAPGLGYVRQWMITHCRIIASIDLHPDTFQPRNGTQTSVMLLQRKADVEMQREHAAGQVSDYSIFMAQVPAIGHDKRGNPVYRRNEDGEEILVEVADPESDLTYTRRVRDDDTAQVADEFIGWKREQVLGW
jgi:type I restriction enzyme M protein